MLLGIVSDTHGHVENTRRAIRMLDSLGIEQVIHCGDIGSTEIPPLFAAWPTHFVFGNVDYNEVDLREAIAQSRLKCHGRFGELTLGQWKLAFLHGDDQPLLCEAIEGGRYDLVCHGHTHVARQARQGKTLILNPGAMYRANPHSIAVVDAATLRPSIIAV